MDLASDLLPVTQDLLSGAVAFVASFLPLIVAADPASFAALPLARLLDVLRSDRLCCPEREVFRAVASVSGRRVEYGGV